MTDAYLGFDSDVSTVTFEPPVNSNSSKLELRLWRAVIFGLGGTVVCVLGISCNVMAVLVLAKFKSASSAPFLLICLACLDAIYLLSMLLTENMATMSKAGVISVVVVKDFILPTYRYLYPFPFVAQTCISYTVLLISVERFIVVAWPFKAYVICSKKVASIAMTTIVILSVVFNIPNILAYEYKYEWSNKTRSYQQRFVRSEFGNSSFYTEAFFKWTSMSVNFIVPFLLLVAVNVSLMRALRLSSSLPGVQNRSHPEYRLTIMVFCMTTIFFLFELLESSSFIFSANIVTYNQMTGPEMRFTAIADLLTEINSAVNFVIYCTTGRKFREMFRRVFLPCLKQQRHTRAVAAVTLKNLRAPAAKNKVWTSWEFLASNIRCYHVRPSDGSISSSSTKSSKTSSLTRYNSHPNVKNVV